MKSVTVTLAFAAIFVVSANGQGFLNLNFESAQNLPGNPGNGALVPVTNALRDWTAYDGSAILSEIFYGSNTLVYTENVTLEGGSLALSGNWSAGLYDGGSISQTAVVPDSAESLLFEANGPGPGGSIGSSSLVVTLGGQKLSLSPIYDGPDYIEYGANIPISMDEQMEALTFSCEGPGSGNILLDDIQFSSLPTPEPGEWALLGLGAGLFYMRKRPPSPRLRRTGRKRRVLTIRRR